MSCDRETNTHKVTVLGDFEHNYKGRHWREDAWYDSRDWDYSKALHDQEASRDLMREILETKFQLAREVVAAGAAAVAESKETKFDVIKEILTNRAEQERVAREQLRDLLLICRPRERGCHD